jgi:hypothetical protein
MSRTQSNNFQNVDFSHMVFPNYLRIDYIRVWQRSDGTIGCDPDDHPTADFIAKYADVYANPNLTTWAGAGESSSLGRAWTSCVNVTRLLFPQEQLEGLVLEDERLEDINHINAQFHTAV